MRESALKNDKVVEQLPGALQALMAFERFHLHNVELFWNTAEDPTFNAEYFPQNCGAIRLPCYWVPRNLLYVYGDDEASEGELRLTDRGGQRQGKVLLPIHPTALDNFHSFLRGAGARNAAEDGIVIWAVPTSSTRTFLAWPDQEPEKAVFIKTALYSPIFGDRRLTSCIVARSVGLSRLVSESSNELPDALHYFPERFGFVPRSVPGGGAIVRSIPAEIKHGKVWVAPLFSLLGGQRNLQPLFLAIIERSGMDPWRFLEDTFCATFARLWLDVSMNLGLLLEAHAQDLMLALSPDLTPLNEFYYRDFEGLQVDWQLRACRGLPVPQRLPRSWAWRETYATWGYQYSDLAWYKWRISLFDYLYWFLSELDTMLVVWQQQGLIGGRKFKKDTATELFSLHMTAAVEERYGVPVGAQFDCNDRLNKFVLFLMKLRRDLVIARHGV